ncbi:MAG: hypothetical protein ABI790_13765 [Betaproteobacteria bacterium]
MRYAVLLFALWPLICCERCDYTPLCIALSVGIAILLYAALSIVHELRLLAGWGHADHWPR